MSADIVRRHLHNGDYLLAEKAAQNAIDEAAPEEAAELWALLARVEHRLGRPREALRAAETACALQPSWEATLALGEASLASGNPARSAAVLADALEHLERTALDDPSERLRREHDLRIALTEAQRAGGHPESALAHAHRAVALAEQLFGPAHTDSAEAWLVLGQCQRVLQQPLRARESLLRALALRRETMPHHPDVAHALDALGLLDRAQNRPTQAIERHREALGLWAAQGPGTDSGTRQLLAQALHRTGDFAGARDEMARAWETTRSRFGADHVDTWIASFELGRFRMDCGEVHEGLHAMERARARTAELLGRDHPTVKAMDRWL